MRQVRGTDHESGLHIICLSCCWNTGVKISRSLLDSEVWSSGEKSSLDIKVLEAGLLGGSRGSVRVPWPHRHFGGRKRKESQEGAGAAEGRAGRARRGNQRWPDRAKFLPRYNGAHQALLSSVRVYRVSLPKGRGAGDPGKTERRWECAGEGRV